MKISHIDHIVLTVADIPTSVNFYEKVLGMNTVSFGNGRVALTFGNQKINLHQCGNELEPKAKNAISGSADLCFIIEGIFFEAMEHVKKQGVVIIEGPIQRTGAQGLITSFYLRDPDENLIEISKYLAI
ncbi:VOC family protein [Plesiomonas sp.]|uniref:VOC family protein n=1 Tax=Plesiomonas sp. TaxID=2486279 RepID=UPI003F35887A